MKPEIFIGSSVEGIEIAKVIEQHLEHKFNVTVWDSGVFNIGNTPIDDLLDQLSRSDFGIFVFSPDDKTLMRKQECFVARDNVLYELGLYTGKLGRKNTFVIKPKNIEGLHLPSDLNGIYIGSYDNERKDNLKSATSSFCTTISSQIFNVQKYSLSGKWKFTWEVNNSTHYPSINPVEVNVFHYENTIKFAYSFDSLECYKFQGTIKEGYLNGTWTHENKLGYNGTFQMELAGNSKSFSGIWTGWSKSKGIKSGKCSLEKITKD